MKLFLLLLLVAVVNNESTDVNLEWYKDVATLNTRSICSFPNADVTEECREQLVVVCGNTTLLWTLFDASAKFPFSGLTYSSRTDYGNFDQCFSVDHSYAGGRILGEYCAVGQIIPNLFSSSQSFQDLFRLAICRPNACKARDYNAILNSFLNISATEGLYVDGMCETKESASFTGGDIAVVTVFGIFALLMALSTLYDFSLGKRKGHPIYLAFSVISNGKKLLHISRHSTSKENIEVFNGLRVISMLWIVAGHSYVMWDLTAVTNASDVNDWTLRVSSFYITASPLAVDTFFYMSGFFLAFQYFKREIRSFGVQVRTVPHMIIHRYLRLTPVLLMLFLVSITFFVHLGSGPLWHIAAQTLHNNCEKHWWRLFLYIQNYFDINEICLLHTWYLSADMQLFLVSPLIIIPLSILYKKSGFRSSIAALLVINLIWTILPMLTKLLIREYTNEYDTHSRLIDYFLGAMMGFFMRVKMDKPFLYMVDESKRFATNLFSWIVVLLGLIVVIVCYQDQLLNHGFESIQVFQSLMRPAWCIGLSWIVYSCYHGRGGFVNWILCRPIFQVLGRLTYTIYLLHVVIIGIIFGTLRTKLFFSAYNVFYLVSAHYVVTVILALIWSLAFESPLVVLEKHLLGGNKRPVKQDVTPRNGSLEETFKSVVDKE